MKLDDVIKILLAGASLCLGSYLTALRSKIAAEKIKNKLHYAFYGVTIVFFVVSIISLIYYWDSLIYVINENHQKKIDPNYFALTVIVLCIVATIFLFLFTRKNLVGKHQYKTPELDPIVNKFTTNADKKNIKLLAGDINFFGNSPKEMDSNSQYQCLKKEAFREIHILCLKPNSFNEKLRYGKIINDLPQTILKYYNPPQADLLIRGRLKTLNNVSHLLIYKKIQSGVYEALVTDTANPDGAMYNHLWNLVWELAQSPSREELNGYRDLYRG